jgi:hypothetical protein
MGKRVHGVMEWLYSKENREKPYITFDRLCQTYDEQWLDHWLPERNQPLPDFETAAIRQLIGVDDPESQPPRA